LVEQGARMLQDNDCSGRVLADHRHINENVASEVWTRLLHTPFSTIQPDEVPVDVPIFIVLGRL
jgi:hypothetical protein